MRRIINVMLIIPSPPAPYYSPPYGDRELFCMVDPRFLAPFIGCQALAFVTGAIAIGLLAETFSVLTINPL